MTGNSGIMRVLTSITGGLGAILIGDGDRDILRSTRLVGEPADLGLLERRRGVRDRLRRLKINTEQSVNKNKFQTKKNITYNPWNEICA